MKPKLEFYRYQPLEHREIRVLQIDVDPNISPQDITTDLCCSLLVVSLDKCNAFDALSYTWGPATMDEQMEWAQQIFTTVLACCPIHVDGKIALVTKSLRNALRRLRQSLHPESIALAAENHFAARSKLIWIDGLCINQQNDSEKNQQAPLMADIYSKANLVHAYVGEHDASSLAGLEAGVALGNLCHDAFKSNFRKEKAMGIDQIVSLLGLPKWRAWVKFLCRKWFFRAWVMQEIILETRDITLTCGATSIVLTHWVNCLNFLGPAGWGQYLMIKLQDELDMVQYKERASRWLTLGHPLQSANQMRMRLKKTQTQAFYALSCFVCLRSDAMLESA